MTLKMPDFVICELYLLQLKLKLLAGHSYVLKLLFLNFIRIFHSVYSINRETKILFSYYFPANKLMAKLAITRYSFV